MGTIRKGDISVRFVIECGCERILRREPKDIKVGATWVCQDHGDSMILRVESWVDFGTDLGSTTS